MAAKARRARRYEDLFTGTAKSLVKGVGHVIGGDRRSTGRPLNEADHGTEIMHRSRDTIMKSRAASMAGAWDTDECHRRDRPRVLEPSPGRRL